MTVKSELLLCPYPFSRTHLSRKSFIPCSSDWLKLEQNNSPELESPWNSKSAIEMRAAHLRGDFSMCRRDLCQEPLIDFNNLNHALSDASYYLSEAHIEEAKSFHLALEAGPGMISFGGSDNRCNLKCTSCRDQLITNLSKKDTKKFFEQVELLKEYKKDLHILRFGDNGEVFFSPWLKRMLKISSPKVFPKLKEICLVTNGTLLDQKMWEKLKPGTDYIKEINVSMDAGNEVAYQKIRGANWEILIKNLQFISRLRSENKIERFFLNFAVQMSNYESLNDLFQLAEKLRVDAILIHPLANRKHLEGKRYMAMAIHKKEHPLHKYYSQLINQLLSREYFFKVQYKIPVN